MPRCSHHSDHNVKVHRACGGGVSYIGPAPADARPQFRCSKCEQTWTCGMGGGPWASLVPKTAISQEGR